MQIDRQLMQRFLRLETLDLKFSPAKHKGCAIVVNKSGKALHLVGRDCFALLFVLSMLNLFAFGTSSAKAASIPVAEENRVIRQTNTSMKCAGTFAGPLTLASADRLKGPGFKWSYLENFDDKKVNSKGLSGAGSPSSSFGDELLDSVSGDAWWGSGSLDFGFSKTSLGALPTHVGIVWTDGKGSVTFEAWGPCGYIGKIGPFAGFPDSDYRGGKSEDRYFEVKEKGGISKIRISNTIGGIEVDDLRYAFGSLTAMDTCEGQLEAIEKIEKEAVTFFVQTQREWKTTGKNFPKNSKRQQKSRKGYADDSETQAVKMVDELLMNGALEDKFLKEFRWEKYKNDVQYTFAYLKSCRGDFQGLRRSLKKQGERTEAKLVKIKKLSKEVGKLLSKDEEKFVGSNSDTVGLKDLLLKALRLPKPVGIASAIADFMKAARNAADVGTRTVLLPRLLERTETLAYLNALAKRYETHLNMQNLMLDSIDIAYDIRDCEKCGRKSKKP